MVSDQEYKKFQEEAAKRDHRRVFRLVLDGEYWMMKEDLYKYKCFFENTINSQHNSVLVSYISISCVTCSFSCVAASDGRHLDI